MNRDWVYFGLSALLVAAMAAAIMLASALGWVK